MGITAGLRRLLSSLVHRVRSFGQRSYLRKRATLRVWSTAFPVHSESLPQCISTKGSSEMTNEEVIEVHDAFEDAMFYVESNSGLIYEVKFFETFALVRPASPAFYLAIRKVPLLEFSKEFHEYGGDSESIREYLWGVGNDAPITIE